MTTPTKLSDIVQPQLRAAYKPMHEVANQPIIIIQVVEKPTPVEMARPGYETSVKVFFHLPKSKTLYFFTTSAPDVVDPLLAAGDSHFPLEATISFERVQRDHNTFAKWFIS